MGIETRSVVASFVEGQFDYREIEQTNLESDVTTPCDIVVANTWLHAFVKTLEWYSTKEEFYCKQFFKKQPDVYRSQGGLQTMPNESNCIIQIVIISLQRVVKKGADISNFGKYRKAKNKRIVQNIVI